MTRIIRTCAGIGDGIFLIKKLVNTEEKFHIKLPNGTPQRGKQIWDLLPQLAESCEYIPGLNYKFLERYSIHRQSNKWYDVGQTEFNLSMNKHLEDGHRIEDFFPDLDTKFLIDWNLKPWASQVKNDFPTRVKTKYIGIYASAYSTVRQWGFWDWREWLWLIQQMHAERPNWKFVIIGAEWDGDLASGLTKALEENKIPFVSTIGKELGYVGNVMKRLSYGFYFPSGLPIFSETIQGASDLTMFFPPHLVKMMGTFCDPARKHSNNRLKECLFCSPESIYKWWVEVYKGYEKLT